MLLMRLFFAPMLRFELRHYGFALLNTAALTLAITPSLYWLILRRMRRSEALLQQAIGAMLDALIITDAQDRVVEWNAAAERMFQYTRSEALGKTVRRLIAADPDPARPERAAGEPVPPAKDERAGALIEVMARRKDGTAIPVEISASASRWRNGRHAVRVLRDISARKSLESGLEESELQLRLATEMAGIAIWNYDFTSNQMFRTRNHDQLYGLPWQQRWDIDTFMQATHPDDRDLSGAIIQAAVAPGGPDDYAFDFRVIVPDEALRWLWAKGQVTKRDADGRGLVVRGVLLDITRRKTTEARLQRMSQLYAALSQCNQAIVRCSSEQELFPQICRDAVQFGGLKMAWIGMIDAEAGRVPPVASFGTGVDYLESIDIRLSADSPTGRGPTGICLRECRPYWCQDYQQDPATAPWHERGARYGWRSMAALPLLRKGQTVGAFVVYADVPDAFDEAAQKLLVEMAMDISFAMDRFVDERERKQAIEDLRVSDLRLRTIIETEPECVKVVGKDGALMEMNSAGLAMLEVDSIESARTHHLIDFITPGHHEAFRDLHRRVMNGESGTLEFEVIGLKGTRRWLETHAAPMRDAQGAVVSLLGITRDITERKHAENRIQYLANFDALTGLPNRNLLADHVQYAIGLTRHGNENLCVMFVDLDRFKDINDTLGHSLGDAFLIETGKRLRSVLRETDTVSRLGGDEFVLVLSDSGAQAAAHVAEKLLESISRPCRIGPYDLVVTASIGIAIFPNDGKDLETLSRSADTAMYRAKQEGRNGYRFFTAEMQNRATRHMRLTHAMHRALELDQFQLHYQPQIAIGSGNVIGVEALLRWHHPEFGDLSPAEFIPVAEYSGLILPLGEWVLRTAVRQMKSWIDRGHPPMTMAVNLSALQFRHRSLPDLVRDILAEAQLPPECLELELTESVAMHDPQGAIAIMDKLHERGIRMSIDDFGTGYSSLNYLKKFRVYKIKIDQSFIREISSHAEDRAIVSAIINMSKSLGLLTIAEGVEVSEQLAFLSEQGCNEAQGYYYSKPLPAAECGEFLERRTGDA
ncbi:MAG: EAL domain-containing protein [Burkholderiales bacterium]|nr:EAL domain-containing protein [Burkholderiales bacterium]